MTNVSQLVFINRVEDALTRLKLKDIWGEPLVGIEAAGVLAAFHGRKWDDAENWLRTSAISAAEWAELCERMIEEYDMHRLRSSIERKLADLHADQVELDLLSSLAGDSQPALGGLLDE